MEDWDGVSGGGGQPTFFLHISSSCAEISLNTEFELPMLPLSGPKVCGGWVVVGGGCVSLFQC